MGDHVEDKSACRFKGRRLAEGQITPLPRDEIQRAVETYDVCRGDWSDLNHVRSVIIRPLAPRPRNNYLGSYNPTTDLPTTDPCPVDLPMTNPATTSLLDRANLDRDAVRSEVGRGLAGADDGELFLEY